MRKAAAFYPRKNLQEILLMPEDRLAWDVQQMLERVTSQLCETNRKVSRTVGLDCGARHTESIRPNKAEELHSLETSAGVIGAYIAELIEAGTGLNHGPND